MKQLTNLQEANEALARFIPNAQNAKPYTLEGMRALLDFIGNPQDTFKVIHVAGTSGKTSTSYYAAALLHTAGRKVGLTVSPHVNEVNERVQVSMQPLAEAEFCHELSEFLELVEHSRLKPIYFECITAFALWEFARCGVEYALVEVGIGGLKDATNVLTAPDKVCVITDIGLDHINLLGSSLSEIATHKAGIIHPGNVTFCHPQDQTIMDVLIDRCREQDAVLHIIEPASTKAGLDSLPLYQLRNFGLAEAVVDYVLARDGLPSPTPQQRIIAAHMQVPARMEIFKHGDKTIILDGAHNAQKLHALAGSIRAKFPGQRVAALVSFTGGRGFRIESSLEELAVITDKLILTAFQAAKDLPHGPVEPQHLADLAGAFNFTSVRAVADPQHALNMLLEQPEPLLLVTGSFFLMEDIRPKIQKL